MTDRVLILTVDNAQAVRWFGRLLERSAEVRIDDAAHGPTGSRRFDYVPTYILRGLTELHVKVA